MNRWIILAIIVVFVGLVALFGMYFSPEHQAFLTFDRERAAWHRRCDVFRGDFTGSPSARLCQTELDALLAIGKAHGWNQ